MIDWTPYLESICTKYAQWWDVYTLTDVEGKTRSPKTGPLLTDLWVQEIKKEREKPEERDEKPERFTVLEGLRKYAANHILLKGRPGSGKSTALARLLLEEAEKWRSPLNPPLIRGEEQISPNIPHLEQNFEKPASYSPLLKGGRGGSIPILIELRYYQTSILDLILQFLQRHELIIDSNTLEKLLLENNNFTLLLLFDGINELPSEAARQDLQKFRQQYQKIPMIFTTRDIGIGGDLNIEKKLEMLPLNESQMRDFVKAYLPEKGEKMLKQLGNRLKEFGETPLLLWMLCSVFENNESQIPANLGLVFQRFTEIYDHRLKADVPTYQESRNWWRELLQILAWKMTQGESKKEIQVAIDQREAEAVLREYLQGKVEYADNCAKQWLKDLLKHHLIQLESNNKIAFRHQLIQEYYTAEALFEKLPHLSDDELQWHYLNYTKWTETIALMLGLLDREKQAQRVVKLGLEIDLKLGARLAGEVKVKFQKQTVGLVLCLDVPKRFKVELLGLTKSDEVVNELNQALEDSNKIVRMKAAYDLGNIGSKAAIPGLVKALEDSDGYVRSNAAEALDKIGAEAAIPGLLQALGNSDEEGRRNAAEALGNIGTEAAISGLLQALEDSDKDVRSNAAYALGQIGSEAAIPGLLQVSEDSSHYVRENVARALRQIASEAAIPMLLQALEHSDGDVRKNAAMALGNIDTEVAIPGLLKAFLEDSDSSVRWSAAYALGKIGSEAAIPKLLQALEHSDEEVRRNAAGALGKIGSEAAIPKLLQALEHSDGAVRGDAAEALGNIGTEAAIPGLLQALEDSNNWDVRYQAVRALGNIGTEAAIPGLLQALEDFYVEIHSYAAYALGNIGTEATLTALFNALKNPNFVTANNGDTFYEAYSAISTIQDKLKYYQPIPQPMNQQIYISYNWQEDSNEMANQLVQAFEARGIAIIRDKTHTTYKDSIKNFMQQIGQGKCVVAVISDRYLKSENCMFELVEIFKNNNFTDRIFPLVLKDARIYKDIERIDYLEYWEQEKAKLQAKIQKVDPVKAQKFLETLTLYDEISRNIDTLTNIIKDMNTLNLDLHRESEFAAMIQSVETKLIEES